MTIKEVRDLLNKIPYDFSDSANLDFYDKDSEQYMEIDQIEIDAVGIISLTSEGRRIGKELNIIVIK